MFDKENRRKEKLKREVYELFVKEEEIRRLNKIISDLKEKDLDVKKAQAAQRLAEDNLIKKEAELTVAKGQVEAALDKTKAAFAENIIALEDERTTSLEKMYSTYADKLVEVVKASHTFTGLPQNATTITNTGTPVK